MHAHDPIRLRRAPARSPRPACPTRCCRARSRVWAQLLGTINLEMFGHLHNVIHDYDAFFTLQMQYAAEFLVRGVIGRASTTIAGILEHALQAFDGGLELERRAVEAKPQEGHDRRSRRGLPQRRGPAPVETLVLDDRGLVRRGTVAIDRPSRCG